MFLVEWCLGIQIPLFKIVNVSTNVLFLIEPQIVIYFFKIYREIYKENLGHPSTVSVLVEIAIRHLMH